MSAMASQITRTSTVCWKAFAGQHYMKKLLITDLFEKLVTFIIHWNIFFLIWYKFQSVMTYFSNASMGIQSPVLLQRSDDVVLLSANGSAAFTGKINVFLQRHIAVVIQDSGISGLTKANRNETKPLAYYNKSPLSPQVKLAVSWVSCWVPVHWPCLRSWTCLFTTPSWNWGTVDIRRTFSREKLPEVPSKHLQWRRSYSDLGGIASEFRGVITKFESRQFGSSLTNHLADNKK